MFQHQSTILPVQATPFFIHLQDSFSSVKTSLGEKMDCPSLLLEQYPQEALQADLHLQTSPKPNT